jgi:DnaJ-class molecular chaperone
MDHYSALGINRNATQHEIRIAYHKKALIYHPDKNINTSNSSHFTKIKEAYEILSDPTKRSIYDNEYANPTTRAINTTTHEWINKVMMHMYVFASRPLPIFLHIDVSFADIYQRRAKRVNVRVKKRDPIRFEIEQLSFSLINVQTKYEFKGRGDESILPGYPRGDVVIEVHIVDSNVRIDDLFSDLDLFCEAPISLYTLYTASQIPIQLCPGITINIPNDRTLSHCMKSVGLPTTATTRSDLYVTLKIDIPLDLEIDHKTRKILKRHFNNKSI